jgi:hypothetical protein
MNIPDEHKMTQAQAADWLLALEQGDYEQTSEHLCALDRSTGKVTGYCCLGVRAKVAGATFHRGEGDDVLVEIPGEHINLNDHELLDVEYAQNAFGLSHDVQTLLSRLNDGRTCNISAHDPLVEVYKEIAVRATPNSCDGSEYVTIENDKHDFKQIAAVIRKYFIR